MKSRDKVTVLVAALLLWYFWPHEHVDVSWHPEPEPFPAPGPIPFPDPDIPPGTGGPGDIPGAA